MLFWGLFIFIEVCVCCSVDFFMFYMDRVDDVLVLIYVFVWVEWMLFLGMLCVGHWV